jgi:hypothetical protein
VAQPILPIIDSKFPGPAARSALDIRIQLARANDESTLGNFAEASRLRKEALDSSSGSFLDRQLVIEELVRDLHCLNQPEQARAWAEQLDEPVRSIYLGPGRVEPKSIDLSKHSHRLFYLALRTARSRTRRKVLSKFLSQQKQRPTRAWEVLEARKLATELSRSQGEPFCIICCRTRHESRLIVRSDQCVDCLSRSMMSLVVDQLKVTEVTPISRFVRTRFPEASKISRMALPVAWSEEALSYLAQARQLAPAPWTTLDLLSVLESTGRLYAHRDEEIGEDGLHSKGWLKTLEVAEWLARWWYDPGPVTAHQLRVALCWAELGQASQILQFGRWRQKMSFRFMVRLPPLEIKRLERSLLANPSDPFLRAALMIGHGAACNGLSETCCQREYKKHALWFLDNRPDHPGALDICLSFSMGAAEISRRVLGLLERNPENLYLKELGAKVFHYDKPELALEIHSSAGLNCDKALVCSELCREIGDWCGGSVGC